VGIGARLANLDPASAGTDTLPSFGHCGLVPDRVSPKDVSRPLVP